MKKYGLFFHVCLLPFLLCSCFTSSIWNDSVIHEKFMWTEESLKLEQKEDSILVTRTGATENYVIPFDFFQLFSFSKEENIERVNTIPLLNQNGKMNGISCAFFARPYPAVTPVSARADNGLPVFPSTKLLKIDSKTRAGDEITVSVMSPSDFQAIQKMFLYNNNGNAEIVIPKSCDEIEPNLFCIYADRYILLPGHTWNKEKTAAEFFPITGGWITGTQILFTPLAVALDAAFFPFQIVFALASRPANP